MEKTYIKESIMTIRNHGEIARKINKPYIYFDLKPSGIAVRGTDDIEHEIDFLQANRTRGKYVKIPRPILSAYGITHEEKVSVSPLGNNDFFIKKDQKSFPVCPSRRELEGNQYMFRYKNEFNIDLEHMTKIGTISVNENNSLHNDLWALINVSDNLTITMNHHNGVWISIQSQKQKNAYMQLSDIRDIYGLFLQNYPYETVTYNCVKGNVFLPIWFLENVFADKNRRFDVYRQKGNRYILLPVQISGVTGNPIDFTHEVPQKIEICETCEEHKEEIDELVNLYMEVAAKELEILNKINGYKKQLTQLSEAGSKLKLAIADIGGNEPDDISLFNTLLEKALSGKTPEQSNSELDQIKQKPIETLGLSLRSYNCLKRNMCNTIGDVMDVIATDEIRGFRNLGIKCYQEICEKITSVTDMK